MLDRPINVTVSALFGAFVFAFCILVWSASSCEPPSEKQASATQESSDHISCETFNVGFFKRLGIIIALHPNETAAAATAAATAVVALFTLVLSRIGRQQARAALCQFGAATAPGHHQPFVLGPGAEIPSGTVDITHAPLNDLLIHRAGAQFLWGWARYKDVFDANIRHVVEFWFRVSVEGQLAPPPFSGRVYFAFDGPHNRYYDEET